MPCNKRENEDGEYWWDWNYNPHYGCENDCTYCYMKTKMKSNMSVISGEYDEVYSIKNLPTRGNLKVFVMNNGDLFGKWFTDKQIQMVIDQIKKYDQHTFIFLTKNPSRYADFYFPPNCWLGTTIDGTEKFIENGKKLVEACKNKPNNHLFLSMEPLLSDFMEKWEDDKTLLDFSKIKWIIIGSDSNYNAPIKTEKEWVKKIVDESKKYEIAIWIKHHTNYQPQTHEYPFKTGKQQTLF